jgi:L-histidine N-alpha-methyltransferase
MALSQPRLSPIAQDVYEGLTRARKSLPPKLFYDRAGSRLFERITRLPEYYLTRTELKILRARACHIAARVPAGARIVELGAGSAAKTRVLLRAISEHHGSANYSPVDISPAALAAAARQLKRSLPQVRVRPLLADMGDGLDFLAEVPPPRLVMYIGSSIGNFEQDEAARFLYDVRRQLAPGDALLLGTDLVKDTAVLLDAYNDAAGVTAAFNLNVLERINRELGGHFDPRSFRHLALWNREQSRIEMHLQSTRAQVVPIDALQLCVRFAAGETIHTENSHKYTIAGAQEMLREAGFAGVETWTDPQQWFAVHWAET